MTAVAAIAVGRPTFDLEEAERMVNAAVTVLTATNHLVAPPGAIRTEPGTWEVPDCEAIILLQATFTDATLPMSLLRGAPEVPVVLWGFPEPRTGERLRLNSLCGINLTASALGDRDLRYLYADPTLTDCTSALARALSGPLIVGRRPVPGGIESEVARTVASSRIGLIGDHPVGFDPCGYRAEELEAVGGIGVDRIDLDDLFDRARLVEPEPFPPDSLHLDAVGVDATARLGTAMRQIASERSWDAVATRCWPECFTEFGGAACAAMGRLAEHGIPGVCEADVFGAATSIALQAASGNPVLVADLVDAASDGTITFWHCGIAPPSMAHPDEGIGYAVHPNRRLPLLHQFRLRPGRITIARINRSGGALRLVVGGGEILDRPRPYAGTCAVVRPDTAAVDILDTVIAEGLDHHYGITHGDVIERMVGLADALGLETLVL